MINSDIARFNELIFNENVYKVNFVAPISEDAVFVQYKCRYAKPKIKRNHVVAA